MLSAFRIAAGNGDLLRKSRVTDKSVPYATILCTKNSYLSFSLSNDIVGAIINRPLSIRTVEDAGPYKQDFQQNAKLKFATRCVVSLPSAFFDDLFRTVHELG